jgi:hypothetical protein
MLVVDKAHKVEKVNHKMVLAEQQVTVLQQVLQETQDLKEVLEMVVVAVALAEEEMVDQAVRDLHKVAVTQELLQLVDE